MAHYAAVDAKTSIIAPKNAKHQIGRNTRKQCKKPEDEESPRNNDVGSGARSRTTAKTDYNFDYASRGNSSSPTTDDSDFTKMFENNPLVQDVP